MAGRKYSTDDNKKGNMKRKEPSMFVKGMAAIDRGVSRLLTGQVAETNLQKRVKK
tara:strand:- start:7257 stop:7421 length:165 start_codon:yes stop_codon:yes gene_type:complete